MINSILLTDFTGFANTRFDFTKGINVLIGKNGTGKTHVLKCLAATLQARHDFLGKNSASKEQFEYILAEDMIFYFKPDVIGNLVNKGVPSGRANITVTIDGKLLQYSFSSASKTTVKLETDEKWDDRHFIYIPPREMFSLFEGFIGLSSKREISFDQTYINLAHALSLPILRESEDNPLKPAIELLEQELQFKVLQMNGRFYIQTEKGNMEAHLVAEGLRKLASILYLILNGEINADTILFWDEPEANLNPALVKVVAKFIRVLQKCGLQIFVATHDYLLTHTLSLYSEYKEHTNISVKFFGLKKEDKGILVEESDTLAGIQNNPILEEYAAFYDLEQQFINRYE
ncbi:AAA family ATPase [Phocaeicola dorei]|uniref:AAA family ATPase n=1 Tax=Phocaeicola dorei TaxID=357276 RepID=A0A6L3J3K5_9BACT|nr:AAA family ATPase [Phocaeicola dorei]RGZ34243.1 ATP-binding protein [Bacteroides stercoris]RGZ47868.1 ATP-binding protein [Phocaeicola vulgatus]RJU29589.1 ATP-binding protein [Bacteroides sp. AM51-7]KAA5290024.1 AAA family ATPase [Phocaeicola dorei]KAA5298931.1 AAA family ATPase [Phocaeicola dorei]